MERAFSELLLQVATAAKFEPLASRGTNRRHNLNSAASERTGRHAGEADRADQLGSMPSGRLMHSTSRFSLSAWSHINLARQNHLAGRTQRRVSVGRRRYKAVPRRTCY